MLERLSCKQGHRLRQKARRHPRLLCSRFHGAVRLDAGPHPYLRPKGAGRRMFDIAAERRATPPSKCCLPDPIVVRDATALRQILRPTASSPKPPAHRPAPPLFSVHPRTLSESQSSVPANPQVLRLETTAHGLSPIWLEDHQAGLLLPVVHELRLTEVFPTPDRPL